MTTTVTVKANHGWPVLVRAVDPKTREAIPGQPDRVVLANTTQDFYVHSSMDLEIHEIQPDEKLSKAYVA